MPFRFVAVALLLLAVGAACESAAPAAPAFPAAPASGSCPPLTRDEQLEAVFPTLIDGQPVSKVQSARFVETVCVEGGPSGVDAVISNAPAGANLSEVFIGSAETTLEGQPFRITAYRRPGSDEARLLETVAGLAQAVGGDPAKFSADNPRSQAGGKSVRTWIDAEGRTSYLYVADDILVVVDAVSPSQADRILASF